MPSLRRSPLFHAIVVAGASLTAACGSEATRGPADASSADGSPDGSSGPDASAPKDAGAEADANVGEDAGTCPPGSDNPVPPCNFIK